MRRRQVRGEDYRGAQRPRRQGGDSTTSEEGQNRGGGGIGFSTDGAKGPPVIVFNYL
jgi:hypothetical protein